MEMIAACMYLDCEKTQLKVMESGENSKIMGNRVKESKGIQDTEDHLYLHFKCVWVDPECQKPLLLSQWRR